MSEQLTLVAGMGAVIAALSGVIVKLWNENNRHIDQIIEMSRLGGSNELLEKIYQLLETAFNQTKRTKKAV